MSAFAIRRALSLRCAWSRPDGAPTACQADRPDAFSHFVAVDRNGRPVDVPPVIPLTADDERRFAAAKERRRRRLEERTAEEREGERKA